MLDLSQYSGNYQKEIDKRKAINPNDPLIKELEYARYNKVMNDPVLKEKYGNTVSNPFEQNVVGQSSSPASSAAAYDAYNTGLQSDSSVTRLANGTYVHKDDPTTYYVLRGQSPNYYSDLLKTTNDPYAIDQINKASNTSITDPYQNFINEITSYQQALANAQRQSRISALSKARDNALSGLDAEKATIDPYYYDKRNQAAAASDVGALNFAQYMASRGISGSAGALPEMYRNAGLQSQIGRLDTQQAAEHSDIARRRSGIESAYQSDVASANAGIDAQTMQAYIDTMRTVEAQRIADLASQGKTSTGELNLQGQQAQNSEYERQAALIAARYYDNIMAEIQRREKINPNDPLIPYLHAARREKIQTEAEQQAAAMAAASEAEQQAWENAYKSFVATGRITSAEQAVILGLPTDATVADIDIARMNANTSAYNAQTGRINANKPTEKNVKYDYKTDPSFQSDVADIVNKKFTLQDVYANAAALQEAYGYEGYMELVKLATPKE